MECQQGQKSAMKQKHFDFASLPNRRNWVKQKQNVFVSLSFRLFGSETKTKCFCFTQFSVIWQWNKNKMFLFRCTCFLALLAFHIQLHQPIIVCSLSVFFVLFVFLSPHEKHSRKWCARNKVKKKNRISALSWPYVSDNNQDVLTFRHCLHKMFLP